MLSPMATRIRRQLMGEMRFCPRSEISSCGRHAWAALLGVATLFLAGCAGTLNAVGAGLVYERAEHPVGLAKLDLAYRSDAEADPEKHKLDLFLPANVAPGWPTLVFVHGGGWTSGDRATRVLGVEPYRNIGRFYAARGYGVVVPSYRLQPDATWQDQVDDVAAAIAFARREIARRGGDPNAVHLSGHSAGAWLAAWVGLEDSALAAWGIDRSALCGLVLVSGAGYDPEDDETYALGASRLYFEKRFSTGDDSWAEQSSIRRHLDPSSPPALVMNAKGEAVTFERQADLLFGALFEVAPDSERFSVPGLNHQSIVIAMSAEGNPVSDATLRFLARRSCGPAGA